MSSISASIDYKAGMALVLFMLAGWVLPAQAGRQGGDWLQLAEWVGGQVLSADNREYRDSSSSSTRRYPPRQNNSYERSDYANQRNNRNSNRNYDSRNSSRRYDERETVTEQRRYYDGKRAPYSSGAQGSRRYPSESKPVNGQGQNRKGRRAPYSSGSSSSARSSGSRDRGRQDTSLDDAVSRIRRQSDGRVLSAETVRKDSQKEHRVRIITDDGRVRRYRMDAQTGNLLPRKR